MSAVGGGAFQPGKLWSLWEIMIELKLGELFSAYRSLCTLNQFLAEPKKPNFWMPADNIDEYRRCAETIQHRASELGLRRTLESATDLADFLKMVRVENDIALFPFPQFETLRNLLDRLCAIIPRELSDIVSVAISQEKVSYFAEDGSEYKALSNDIGDNVSEAAKCIALDRNAACVYHLMLAMEIGVQLFGKKLGVNPVKTAPAGKRVIEKSWDVILNELNAKISTMPQRTLAQKRRHQSFSEIQTHLRGVKDAWRNPTMHPRQTGYTSLQAMDIMNHVCAFLRSLAGVLNR